MMTRNDKTGTTKIRRSDSMSLLWGKLRENVGTMMELKAIIPHTQGLHQVGSHKGESNCERGCGRSGKTNRKVNHVTH